MAMTAIDSVPTTHITTRCARWPSIPIQSSAASTTTNPGG